MYGVNFYKEEEEKKGFGKICSRVVRELNRDFSSWEILGI